MNAKVMHMIFGTQKDFGTLIIYIGIKGSERNFCGVKTLIFLDAKGQVFIYKFTLFYNSNNTHVCKKKISFNIIYYII